MIGKILKTMRKIKGLTQEELSNITGIPQNTISQYENKTVDIIANKCDFKIQFVNKDITLNSDNIDRKEL